MVTALAFEPITGAVSMFLLEQSWGRAPARIIPRAGVTLRRHRDIFMDVAVNEAAEPV
jgi:hypothetical protein